MVGTGWILWIFLVIASMRTGELCDLVIGITIFSGLYCGDFSEIYEAYLRCDENVFVKGYTS